jgi:hypothetical protein
MLMLKRFFLVGVLGLLVLGCAPEVGSDAWCEKMKEKPKGEWSTNEATAYGKHCLFKSSKEN